jgi:hypothetical protein
LHHGAEKVACRRKWYKLHKAIVEFHVFSTAQVTLELLVDGQTARVLSTWDLGGLKSFLEVAAPIGQANAPTGLSFCEGIECRALIPET